MRTTAATRSEDTAAMISSVSQLLGQSACTVIVLVESTWRDGITFAEWLDLCIPTSIPLAGLNLD